MNDDADNLEHLISQALNEDQAFSDITTQAILSGKKKTAHARILAKENLILSGLDVAKKVFHHLDPHITWQSSLAEGDAINSGDTLVHITGDLAGILTGERVALNFLQHLCGIATLTRRFVEKVAGTQAQILDTRKTLPGLRALEKSAVKAGGGINHRGHLAAAFLIKENHITAAGSITQAVRAVKASAFHHLPIQIEVTTLEQIPAALSSAVDLILFDNMTVAELTEAVACVGRHRGKKILTEASGGIQLDNVRQYALTGVDRISIGALTHSAKAGDISLIVEKT